MISRFFTHPVPKPKPETKIDPQKQKLYKMERTFIGCLIDSTVPLDKLQEIADYECKNFKVGPVRIEQRHVDFGPYKHAFGWAREGEICLNKAYHGQNLGCLLHELAHHLTFEMYPDIVADHSPEFVSVYRYLLDKYKIMPEDCFDLLCEKWGVRHNEL